MQMTVVSRDSLPPAPVRPAALHHALTHNGCFILDSCTLVGAEKERGKEWHCKSGGSTTSSNVYMPTPLCLGGLGTFLPSVTMEEMKWAESVLEVVCEVGELCPPSL